MLNIIQGHRPQSPIGNAIGNYSNSPINMQPNTLGLPDQIWQALIQGRYNVVERSPTSRQPNPTNNWSGMLEGMPTTWDWQGGAASPFGIRTPSLAYNWHYDDEGGMVPNKPKPEGWQGNWGMQDKGIGSAINAARSRR